MSTRSIAAAHAAAAALLAVVLALGAAAPVGAHKAITSKYSFNEDMFPLFRDHCGACHVDGGAAPMSLLTHEDAAPWAESLRIELLSEDPPKPWHQLVLTAREFDMVLVWANGGTPRGDVANAPPAVTLKNDWAAGTPDLTFKMPASFTLPGPENEAVHEAVWSAAAAAGKSVHAVDVLPGLPAIVRAVEVSLKLADGSTQPLGTWMPGRPLTLKSPMVVPAGASVVARLGYGRTWKYEGQDLTDTSTVGLHFSAPASARPADRR